MKKMLEAPEVKEMLSNPEKMQEVIQANPTTRAMLDSNPQMKAMMANTELLRESMEVLRNPDKVQEIINDPRVNDAAIKDLAGSQGQEAPPLKRGEKFAKTL